MKLTDFFLAELEREAAITRRALQRVPEGRNDWKPHGESMALGHLASLVATMPAWIETMIHHNELDLKSSAAAKFKPCEWRTRAELTAALDCAVAEARQALASTTDDHLEESCKFVIGGRIVDENPRHVMISEDVFRHMAHHRGQLTVYLRLNQAALADAA